MSLTQPAGHHLAQFNWANLRYDADDPRVAEFVGNVSRMNYLAERFPGFVWRHLDDRKALRKLKAMGVFAGGPRFTTTLSVWESPQALQRFSFQTIHSRFYAKRLEWFLPHETAHIVLWWVPEGKHPTIPEAVARAEKLLADGESDEGFGWSRIKEAEPA